MATKAQAINQLGGTNASQQNGPNSTGVLSRRGMSAKGRKEAMQHSKELQMSQTPIKGGNPQGPLEPNATAAGSMTQTKNLLTKKASKPAYM